MNPDNNLQMIGIIRQFLKNQNTERLQTRPILRTKERCSTCQGQFTDTSQFMICQNCLDHRQVISIPKYYYLELAWRGEQYKIYYNSAGERLNDYEKAQKLKIEIGGRLSDRNFDPNIYKVRDVAPLKFEVYAEKWVKHYEEMLKADKIAPVTLNEVERYSRLYYVPYFQGQDVRDIRAKHIEEFYLSLDKRLAQNTRRVLVRYFHKFLSDLQLWEVIDQVPRFPKLKAGQTHTPVLSDVTIQKVYDCLGDRYKGMYFMLWKQGMRPNEVRALWWEDVNFKDKTITIRRGFSENVYRERTKTGQIRTIPLDPDVYDMLLQKRETAQKLTGFIFLTRRKKPYDRATVSHVWKRAMEKAGLPHARLYSLRHTFASNAINRGIDKYLVMKFLGTTVESYIHVKLAGLQKVLPVVEAKGPETLPATREKRGIFSFLRKKER